MPLYFISTTLYFWVPNVVMGALVLPRLSPLERKTFWLSLLIFYPLMFGLEFLHLSFDIWTFAGAKDPYLGVYVFGVPVEEFWFLFGAVPFVAFLYWIFCGVLGRRRSHA